MFLYGHQQLVLGYYTLMRTPLNKRTQHGSNIEILR
jgi:hypothetical protein